MASGCLFLLAQCPSVLISVWSSATLSSGGLSSRAGSPFGTRTHTMGLLMHSNCLYATPDCRSLLPMFVCSVYLYLYMYMYMVYVYVYGQRLIPTPTPTPTPTRPTHCTATPTPLLPHTNTQKGRGKEKEKEKREREKRKRGEREKIMKGERKDKEKEKRERERRKRKTDYSYNRALLGNYFQLQLLACLRRRINIALHYSRTLCRGWGCGTFCANGNLVVGQGDQWWVI